MNTGTDPRPRTDRQEAAAGGVDYAHRAASRLSRGTPARVEADRRAWRLIGLAAWVYFGFILYGSLAPLRFTTMPLDVAYFVLLRTQYLPYGPQTRVDWVTNVLVFVPLYFLWTGLLWRRLRRGRVMAGLLLAASGFALSAAIEYTQLYFPPRSVALNDVVAEGLGGVIGIGLWALFGGRFADALRGLLAGRPGSNTATRLLSVYLLGLYVTSLWPLDLSLDPEALYRKWIAHRVILTPFSLRLPFTAWAWEAYLKVAAFWLPVGFLLGRGSRLGPFGVLGLAGLLAATLEFLQVFVLSRVSDVTDILLAVAGAALGLLLARLVRAGLGSRPESLRRSLGRAGVWAAALAVWVGTALWLFQK